MTNEMANAATDAADAAGSASRTVMVEVRLGKTPARDLPWGLLFAVADVLDAYGLRVKTDELDGQGITEVMLAVAQVVDRIPVEHGGRLLPDGTVDRS